MTPTQAFAQARDFLMAHRDDYEAAYRGFDWPQLDTFNWALDWFDVHAKGNERTALWVVDEDGSEQQLSFAELSERSNRVANFLRAQGVQARRPHPADAGQRRAAVGDDAGVDQAGLGGHPGDDAAGARRPARPLRARRRPPRRRRIGATPASSPTSRATTRASSSAARRPAGAASRTPMRRAPSSRRTGRRRPTIRCCCTSPPAPPRSRSWSSTATRAIRSAICRRCTGSGCSEGDVHLNISSPGWAKHAWSCFFAPWNAGATRLHLQLRALQRQGGAGHRRPLRRDHAVRAADRLAAVHPGGPAVVSGEAARGDRRRRAAQPGDHRAGAERLGPDAARRLRPDRDDGADRQLARPDAEAGLDGPAAAGLPGRAARSRRQRGGRRARSRCASIRGRPG